VKRTVGQVANTEKYTERSIRASSRCTCGWSITRLLSGLDKILMCVNHQAYNYPHHYVNSVTGTFHKTATNNISVERTVKVTTYICSTMLVTTYTDKNTDKNRISVQ